MKVIIVCVFLVAFALAITDGQKDKEKSGGRMPEQAKDRMQKGKSHAPSLTQNMGKMGSAGLRFVREAPEQAKEKKEKGQAHAPSQAQENIGKGKSKQSQS